MFKTPILFLIFNRLDTAQRVFEKIKEQKPKYLYIAADWPRKNKKWEAEACKKTREEILKQIDRDCELKTLFRDENLWCKMAVSWAISRFFENVEQWIILEDDCLPDSSFFGFCETMLEKYKDDERIMHISWECFLPKKWQEKNTYSFSNHVHIRWWATWKRSWNLYDISMKDLPEFIDKWAIKSIVLNLLLRKVAINHFKCVYEWEIDTWDYQRVYCIRKNHWLSIFPLINLVGNIWFSANALHTKNDLGLWNQKTYSFDLNNIKHPSFMLIDDKFRKFEESKHQFAFKQYFAMILKKLWLYEIVSKILSYK